MLDGSKPEALQFPSTLGLMGDGGRNVEIVRGMFEAARADYVTGERGAFEAAVRELCAVDVLIVPNSALASGSAGPYRGRDALLQQQDAVAARWPDFELIPEEYVDVPPSTVVMLGKVAARRGDGSGYAVEIGCLVGVEEERIVSVHSYQGKRRALEEAGVNGLAPGDRP